MHAFCSAKSVTLFVVLSVGLLAAAWQVGSQVTYEPQHLGKMRIVSAE